MKGKILTPSNNGMTVERLAGILINLCHQGHAKLIVMQDLTGGKVSPIKRGDIGITADGTKVLVLRRDEIAELKPSGVINV